MNFEGAWLGKFDIVLIFVKYTLVYHQELIESEGQGSMILTT